MDAQRNREHLFQADRHIAWAKRQIERPNQIVKDVRQSEDLAVVAMSLLQAMEDSLHAFEQHREIIVAALKNGSSGDHHQSAL